MAAVTVIQQHMSPYSVAVELRNLLINLAC